MHLVLAWLTAQIALGGGGEQASQSDALATLAQQPFGQVLLLILVAGFVLLALWQATELVTRRKAADQARAGGKLVLYGAVAWTSQTFACGGRSSSNKQTKDFTATLMDAPAGPLLVVWWGSPSSPLPATTSTRAGRAGS